MAVLLATCAASATDEFPTELKKHWAIKQALPVPGRGCRLCHNDDSGGTITRPFGITVRGRGAIKYNTSSLDGALDQVRARNVDSDHDGVTDYDELVKDGTNPSDPKSVVVPPPVDAGEGGQAGTPSAGGEGGQANFVQPPPYTAPPPDDLPPPFEHGCAMAPRSARGLGLLFTLALAALGRSRRRRRTRA